MSDAAMVWVCLPTGVLYGLLIASLHAEWVATGARWEAERRAAFDARVARALEGVEWETVQTVQKTVQTVQDEETPRTYARQKAEDVEPGVTAEWDIVTVNKNF